MLAERVFVTFTAADGTKGRSLVKVRFDPGSKAKEAPRESKFLLSLGRLEIMATPGRLVATYRGEASTYYEAEVPDPLTPESFRVVLPRVPLPQIEWCLGDEVQRLSVHPYGLTLALASTDPDGTRHFTAEDGKLTVVPPAHGVHPRRIDLQGEDGSALRLDISAMDASDWATWDLDVTHRQRVASLADLRTRAEPTLEGQEFRDLGFTRTDLSSVTLKELVESAAASPHAFVFIVFDAGRDGSPAESVRSDLAAGREAVRVAAESLKQSGAPGAALGVPMYLVRGLPLAELDVPGLATSAGELAGGVDPRSTPMVLNTTSAGWLLNDQLGDSKIALVVLSKDRTVTLATPLDGRAEDGESLTAEVRGALARALVTKDSEPRDPPAGAPK